MSGDTYVVLRSSGERTAPPASQALRAGFPSAFHEEISEAPLERSLTVTLERAVELSVDWLLICDADVVVAPHRLRNGLQMARTLPRDYAVLTLSIDDWLFGTKRVGGFRIYRADHALASLDVLRSSPDRRRSESSMISAMTRMGYPAAISESVVGIHDRDQWLSDYYRKGYFFSHKHVPRLGGLIDRWRTLAVEHLEFRAAMIGLADGLLGRDSNADVTFFDRKAVEGRLAEFAICELPALSTHETEDIRHRTSESLVGTDSQRWLTEPLPSDLIGQWKEYRRFNDPAGALADLRGLYDKLGFRSILPNLRASFDHYRHR